MLEELKWRRYTKMAKCVKCTFTGDVNQVIQHYRKNHAGEQNGRI